MRKLSSEVRRHTPRTWEASDLGRWRPKFRRKRHPTEVDSDLIEPYWGTYRIVRVWVLTHLCWMEDHQVLGQR